MRAKFADFVKKFVRRQGAPQKSERSRSYLGRADFEEQHSMRAKFADFVKKFVRRQSAPQKSERSRSYLRRADFEEQHSMRAKFADKWGCKGFDGDFEVR